MIPYSVLYVIEVLIGVSIPAAVPAATLKSDCPSMVSAKFLPELSPKSFKYLISNSTTPFFSINPGVTIFPALSKTALLTVKTPPPLLVAPFKISTPLGSPLIFKIFN